MKPVGVVALLSALAFGCSSGAPPLTDAAVVWCAAAVDTDSRLEAIDDAAEVLNVLGLVRWMESQAGAAWAEDGWPTTPDGNIDAEQLRIEGEARWGDLEDDEIVAQYLDSEDGRRACQAAFDSR